jgi:very-short-patch-repair endonuclease
MKIISIAQKLRKNITPPEVILWCRLRNRQLNGAKFRRQHPIGRYVVDFYCHQNKLVIELDGPTHGLPAQIKNDP